MSKLLVSGVWILLSLTIVNAVWCNKCTKGVFASLCSGNEEFCWADEKGGCHTKSVYHRKRLLHTDVGCSTSCIDFTEPRKYSKWVQFACCFKDYCN